MVGRHVEVCRGIRCASWIGVVLCNESGTRFMIWRREAYKPGAPEVSRLVINLQTSLRASMNVHLIGDAP